MFICNSPKLIAAYHVFHRRLVPRHPPYALHSLIYCSYVRIFCLLLKVVNGLMHFTKIFLDLVNMTQRNYKLYSKKRFRFLTYCNLRITLKNIWLTLILYIINKFVIQCIFNNMQLSMCEPKYCNFCKKNGQVKSYLSYK